MSGERLEGLLAVVGQFANPLVGQQRLQPRQRVACIQPYAAQGKIEDLVGRDSQGQSDHSHLALLSTFSHQANGQRLGPGKLGQPFLQSYCSIQQGILAVVQCRACRCLPIHSSEVRQPVQHLEELEFAEELHHRVAVIRAGPATLQIELDGHVGDDSSQPLALPGLRLLRLQSSSELLRHHFVEALIDTFHTAKLLDQFGRRFPAYPWDSRNVVSRITRQSLDVRNLRRLHAVFLGC